MADSACNPRGIANRNGTISPNDAVRLSGAVHPNGTVKPSGNVTPNDNVTPSGAALPVAREWFRIRLVNDALTLIDEPRVHKLLQANIWLIGGGDRDLLFDCGLGVASLRAALGGRLRPEPVLVLSHAHLDHMGSAHEFADCRAHPAEAVENPPPGSLDGPVLAAELGLDEALPPLLIHARPDHAYDPAAYRLRPARVTGPLADGDIVDPGGRPLTVLHLPGHSPGSIALFDDRDGTLFSGDVVYDGGLLDTITGADRDLYRESMRRLRELPVRVVRPGHGPSFGPRRLHSIIERYLKERP
jgi:glyoxylase-like metal-dependent hydrolase (beta-lactamase superfamily II)